jgi:phage shock protein PspC (stress-responsive transcriptional regulator)
MKKTVIININGIIFHIDEDAFERLSGYLDALKRYFGSNAEGQEIIADIEARIAELLQPKISDDKQSVTIEDIEELITILGRPEDIAGANEDAKTQDSSSYGKGSRRLYRDPDNSVIGGVCGGLGAYFSIDPVIFRIIFLALLFAGGISIWVYIILWIAVPRAITASQKLEMRGENVNISNLEKKIKEELEDVSSNFRKHQVGDKIGGGIHEVFHVIGKFLLIFLNIIKYIIAAAFILIAISFIIAIISGLFFSNFTIDEPFFSSFHSVQDLVNSVIDPFSTNFILLLATIIVVLPCAALIYWGLKILIRFKAKDKIVSVVLSFVWILAIITMFAMLFNQFNKFRHESTLKDTIALKTPSKHIFYLKAKGDMKDYDYYFRSHFEPGFFGIDRTGSRSYIVSPVRIYVERTNNAKPTLEIVKKGRGASDDDVTELLKTIRVNISQEDTVISIDPIFRLPEGERWKFNRVKVYLYLPDSMDYHYDKKIEPFLYYYGRDDWWENDELNLNDSDMSLEEKLRAVENDSK